jgi:hypothetical protein
MIRKLLTIPLLLCSMLLSDCSPKKDIEQHNPEILSDEFSLETAKTEPPDNITILMEVEYYGMPGYSSACEDDMYDEPRFSRPTIVADPEDTELMLSTQLETCGWSAGEELTGKITFPDGRTELQQIIADDRSTPGEAWLSFRPTIEDPEGVYTFELSNGSVTLESNAYFSYPGVPRVYELNDHQLVFISFPPNEILRLLMYMPEDSSDPDVESAWRFVAWQMIKVDENGYLVLDAPVRGNAFVAITASGDEYATDRLGPIQTDWISGIKWNIELLKLIKEDSGCPRNVQSRVPDDVRQVKIATSGLALYSQPRTTARVITNIQSDQIVDIKGPICVGDSVWWEMSIDGDYEILAVSGYALETGNENFSVEPVK